METEQILQIVRKFYRFWLCELQDNNINLHLKIKLMRSILKKNPKQRGKYNIGVMMFYKFCISDDARCYKCHGETFPLHFANEIPQKPKQLLLLKAV